MSASGDGRCRIACAGFGELASIVDACFGVKFGNHRPQAVILAQRDEVTRAHVFCTAFAADKVEQPVDPPCFGDQSRQHRLIAIKDTE